MLNDFRTLGFNASEGNRKVFDAMLNWVGAFSGINMNYRFSNPGTTQRNRQDQLYTEAFFPFANETHHRPHQRHHRGTLRSLHADQHLSARDGGLFVERVLGRRRRPWGTPTRRARRTFRVIR